MRRIAEWIVGITCVLVAAAVMFPVLAQTKTSHPPWCLRNLKRSSTAMMLYCSDADDRFPDRDAWTDVLHPYAESSAIFHCPQAADTDWGYAFNGALDRTKQTKLDEPATTPMLYDSVNPMENASDLVTSLPAIPRHTRNNVGYADGHASAMVAH